MVLALPGTATYKVVRRTLIVPHSSVWTPESCSDVEGELPTTGAHPPRTALNRSSARTGQRLRQRI